MPVSSPFNAERGFREQSSDFCVSKISYFGILLWIFFVLSFFLVFCLFFIFFCFCFFFILFYFGFNIFFIFYSFFKFFNYISNIICSIEEN